LLVECGFAKAKQKIKRKELKEFAANCLPACMRA
jgi:hypothetical protein